ncbi:hypothetical protein GQ55_6G054100 [Panicum hallii var. hallii]|uniref:Uncharacterized protein n=1 Tax=Panicum hallii var. hallii TaxID=1504633 RepID=A0A2T7D451_9POAL|nr:hypothetical protein GQ55_6G054100 [Panicum hallii var. hallii]
MLRLVPSDGCRGSFLPRPLVRVAQRLSDRLPNFFFHILSYTSDRSSAYVTVL